MTETREHVQLRLLQEQECARTFMALPLGRWDRTLLFFNYGEENQPGMAVSFKTSLSLPRLVLVVQKLLASWRTGAPREATRAGMPPMKRFLRANEAAKQAASKYGWGHALIVGDGPAYAASADRRDMIRVFENELLPHWRRGDRGGVGGA